MKRSNIIIFFSLFISITVGVLLISARSQSPFYYYVETITHPNASFLLDESGNMIKVINALYMAQDPRYGTVLVTSNNDFTYYDVNGAPRFQKHISKNIHHAVAISPLNGDLYIIANQVKDYFGIPTIIDSVERYSKEGELLAVFDGLEAWPELFKRFKPFIPLKYQEMGRLPLNHFGYAPLGSTKELFHFNFLQIIPSTPYSGKIAGFEEGNIMITLPYFGSFLILDGKDLTLRWSKSLALDHLPLVKRSWMMTEDYVTGFNVHSGHLTPEGALTFFRNQDFLRSMACLDRLPPAQPCTQSECTIFHGAVMSIDPFTSKEIWKVESSDSLKLTTITQGSVFEVSRGDILVTSSNNGRFYRMTKSGKVLFEYSLEKNFPVDQKNNIYTTRELTLEEAQRLIDIEF